MPTFSERLNEVQPRKLIQTKDMDTDLRTALWNVFYINYLASGYVHSSKFPSSRIALILKKLWIECFNLPLHEIPNEWVATINFFQRIFAKDPWYRVYDVIEFIANSEIDPSKVEDYISKCNKVLEKYLSGYRFINNILAPITSEIEIESLERAQEDTSLIIPINTHLKDALSKLSDREQPDYRNSIKESISAVEALCRIITENANATLGDALKTLGKNEDLKIHGALVNAFNNLYGWTSDAQGIRHSLMNEKDLKPDDAIFMLVICSAFINYLLSKSSMAGLQLT
jgi:hypothetical protein